MRLWSPPVMLTLLPRTWGLDGRKVVGRGKAAFEGEMALSGEVGVEPFGDRCAFDVIVPAINGSA